MNKSCSGCGSRLKQDATQCDLCGTLVPDNGDAGSQPGVSNVEHLSTVESEEPPGERYSRTNTGGEAIFCNQCGWKNPAAANYCSRCGQQLDHSFAVGTKPAGLEADPAVGRIGQKGARDVASDAAQTGGVEPGAGRRMAILIGLAVLVIFAVYLIVSVGGRSGEGLPVVPANAPTEPPLVAEFADREQVLRADLQNLSGIPRIEKQRELLTLYFTAQRFDLAGAQAERIALVTGDKEAWIDAANFYYDWMETSDPINKAYYSRKSTSAYRKALELDPDNLDIRTDMAVAYMYDPENSMMAIQETMKVLEADSNHVQANFNRGIMLWQINRFEEAKAQFERVMRLVEDPEDPVYLRAADALSALQSESVGAES